MRLRTPIRQQGVRTARWARWRSYNYGLLAMRCRGVCENPACKAQAPLEPHHIIGREEEPFSSLVELLAGLCRPCHRAVTGEVGRGIDVGLRGRLSGAARERLGERFRINADSIPIALRKLKRAYVWDAERNALTRAA